MKPRPPKFADDLLEMFCSDWYLEEIQGDLHEWFALRVRRQGLFKARFLYFFDVIRFFRSYRFKKQSELIQNSNTNNNAMLRNYFLLALRMLWRKRGFTALNLGGLVVAFTAFLLLFQYVHHEGSYDSFFSNSDRIYRVQTNRYNQGELTTQWAAGAAGAGVLLSENFEEVESFTTLHSGSGIITYGQKHFSEENIYFATPDFFDMFSLHLLSGNPETVLSRPYTAVLSTEMAHRYFDDEDPVGKTILWNGSREFEVTGVYQDIPENSHMAVDILFSFETYVDLTDETASTNMFWDGFMTYVRLQENTDPGNLEKKLPDLIYATVGDELTEFDENMEFILQPLQEIHQTSNYMLEYKRNGDRQSTNFLLIVAFFILLIAWINYINLSTAKSLDRAREVGVRKVLGSYRSSIMKQFITESLVLNLAAFALAAVLYIFLLPWFAALADRPLNTTPLGLPVWAMLIFSVFAGSLLSGFYPAFVLSGFSPTRVLKGRFSTSSKGVWLRKGLVVTQFAISMILMIGTYTVYRQLNFMQEQDPGVTLDQVLVMNGPGARDSLYVDRALAFRNELLRLSDTKQFSTSSHVPGSRSGFNAGGIRLVGQLREEGNQYRVINMDEGYVPLHGLELVAGRNFSNEVAGEERRVLITESASELLGERDHERILNQEMVFWGDTLEIIGVVKDYHHEYMKKAFDPLIFRYENPANEYFSLLVEGSNMEKTISVVEDLYQSFFPSNPFNYFFLDDHYNQQYKADQQFMKVFGLFSVLAILIACMGLFGLTSYYARQRNREISIRKVLGATSTSIMSRLSRDMTGTMLLAMLIAIPLSWWLIHRWLQEFAYQMTVEIWLFIVPALALSIIALLTMSYQTIRAAFANPVESLRSE